MSDVKHIVSIGGGIASTLLLPLWVVSRYGKHNVEFVMARLPNEDPDVWRLCECLEDTTGVPVQYVGTNQHPFDVFFEKRFLGNTRIDPCSLHLKRLVMREYIKSHYSPAEAILYVGIGAYELDRELAIKQRWGEEGYKVGMPLMNYPDIDRAYQMQFCQAYAGFVPRLYQMGFSHNNCGGACVKAGKREWARLLWFLPDVYDWWETNEEKFRREINSDVAILRDEKGKKGKRDTRPLPLKMFRQRIQSRWNGMLPGFVSLMEGYAELEKSGMFDDLDPTPGCNFCDAAA